MTALSHLQSVLEQGHFAVTAEIGPPMSANVNLIRQKAGYYNGYVDAANITDNQSAVVRMSSIATAAIVQQEGVETVFQMTCRDRNRIALQSDILGAAGLGLKNLLCLSGDHQSFGNDPQAKNVYDLDSIQLIHTVKGMRDDKRFINGKEIKTEPQVFIGAAAHPFAQPTELYLISMGKKIAAGAQFFQTQAIFDVEGFGNWMKAVRGMGYHKQTYILAGIIPIKTARSLKIMNDTVAGIRIPPDLIKRMDSADNQEEEGMRITLEIIEAVRKIDGVVGIHLMPVSSEQITPAVVERAGLYPRPQVEVQ